MAPGPTLGDHETAQGSGPAGDDDPHVGSLADTANPPPGRGTARTEPPCTSARSSIPTSPSPPPSLSGAAPRPSPTTSNVIVRPSQPSPIAPWPETEGATSGK